MRTGYLYSWTALLAVGLASAQTPGTAPAPAGSAPAAAQGAPAASTGTGDAKTTHSASTGTGVEGAWDDGGSCQGGKCGLLSGHPLLRNGDNANHGELWDTNRGWFGAEYLLWRGNDFLGDSRSGFRVTGGIWADESHCTGFEAIFLYLDLKRSTSAVATKDLSTGIPAGTPGNVVSLIADQGSAINTGDLLTSAITNTSYFRMWGLEGNFRRTVWWIGGFSFDAIAGFRYLNLDETINATGDFTFQDFNAGEPGGLVSPADPRTTHMSTLDTAQAHNQFYGAQVGVSFCWHCYRLTMDGSAKFAVGGNSQQVTTGGLTTLDAGVFENMMGTGFVTRPAATLPGGALLASPLTSTNRIRVSVIPEWRASVGYQVTDNLNAFVGYNFLWWSNLASVGGLGIGSVGTKDAWYQGLDFGVLFRF